MAEHRRKDGTTFPVEVRVGFIDYGGEEMTLASCRDVTELKRAAEALKESEGRFRSLVQNASDVVTVPGADGTILYESPAVERVLGYRPEELVGKDAFSYVRPDDRGRVLGAFARGTETPGTTFTPAEYRFRHKDGSWRCLEGIGNNLLPDPQVRGVVVNSRDVTGRKEAEEELRWSEANFADAQRLAHLGSFDVDLRTGRGRWSEESWRIFGLAPRRGESLSQEEFERSVHPDDREAVRRAVGEAASGGRAFETTCRIVRPDGSERTVHARAEVVLDEGGRPALLRGTNHDITERRALEERLEHQAFHDPLTGLPNRALLMDRLTHALSHAERRGSKTAVLFLDLDDFKYVNDSLGHEVGDRLLVVAAERLKSALRPSDTAARLGGDEFVALLEGVGGEGEAVRIAGRIAEVFGAPFDLGGREAFVTASVGVALGGRGASGLSGADGAADLLRRADLAMYQAKGAGKARHAVFDPAAERRSVRRLELETGLRRALERDELAVFYQPVVRLSTGEIAGFEALVRWEHPGRGLVPPSEFVPLAEETGLIFPIGRRVLEEACRQGRAWQERHPKASPLIVGANLSARQLKHPGLVEDIAAILQETKLAPDTLTLEVTESALVEDAEATLGALREIRGLGVRFALDDFGTGYSSLSYLGRLPAGLLSGVVGIAHGLGLLVCAEGVESERQLGRAKALGCDLAQGRLFSEPLTAEAATEFLAEGGPVTV